MQTARLEAVSFIANPLSEIRVEISAQNKELAWENLGYQPLELRTQNLTANFAALELDIFTYFCCIREWQLFQPRQIALDYLSLNSLLVRMGLLAYVEVFFTIYYMLITDPCK